MNKVAPLDAHLGYRLRIVSNAVSHAFARRVEALGVTVAEWVFLRILYGTDALSPTEIALRMGMTKGAISKLAERTIDKGLVTRRMHPEDRRAQTLALTSRGTDLVPQIAAIADENDAAFFGVLDAEERRTLAELIGKIIGHNGSTTTPID